MTLNGGSELSTIYVLCGSGSPPSFCTLTRTIFAPDNSCADTDRPQLPLRYSACSCDDTCRRPAQSNTTLIGGRDLFSLGVRSTALLPDSSSALPPVRSRSQFLPTRPSRCISSSGIANRRLPHAWGSNSERACYRQTHSRSDDGQCRLSASCLGALEKARSVRPACRPNESVSA